MLESLMGSLSKKYTQVSHDALDGGGGPVIPLGTYCTVPNLQKSLLLKHWVSTNELNFMVQLFFGNNVVAQPMVIPLATITTYMATISCGVNQIDFIVNFSNVADNSEIAINPVQNGLNGYSYAFFQAVINQFNSTGLLKEFHFFKAVSNNGDMNGNSIVFQVIDTGNNVLYCADLSGYEP